MVVKWYAHGLCQQRTLFAIRILPTTMESVQSPLLWIKWRWRVGVKANISYYREGHWW